LPILQPVCVTFISVTFKPTQLSFCIITSNFPHPGKALSANWHNIQKPTKPYMGASNNREIIRKYQENYQANNREKFFTV